MTKPVWTVDQWDAADAGERAQYLVLHNPQIRRLKLPHVEVVPPEILVEDVDASGDEFTCLGAEAMGFLTDPAQIRGRWHFIYTLCPLADSQGADNNVEVSAIAFADDRDQIQFKLAWS